MWVLASERTIYVIVYKVCVCSVLTELHVVVCQKRGRRETEDFLGRVVVHLSCSVVFLKSSSAKQKKKAAKKSSNHIIISLPKNSNVRTFFFKFLKQNKKILQNTREIEKMKSVSNHTKSARKRRGKRDNFLRNKISKAKGKKRSNAKSKAMKTARRQLKVRIAYAIFPENTHTHTQIIIQAIAQQNKDKGGEKIVASLWPDEAIVVESSSSVSDCARMMTSSRADSALITCNGALCGIITDNDICRRVINQDFDPKTTPVALAMTGKPMTVGPNHFAIDALSTMVDKHFRHLPVAEGTTIYGQLMISKCIGEAVLSLKRKIDNKGSSKNDEVMSVASSSLDDGFISELGQMTLGDLIQSSGEMPPTVMESAKVRDAVRVMADRKVTAVLTTKKDGSVCGIMTTKDVLLRVVAAGEDSCKTSCSRVHTPYPDMVPHTMTILDALSHMSEKHYLHLPVSGGDSTLPDGT